MKAFDGSIGGLVVTTLLVLATTKTLLHTQDHLQSPGRLPFKCRVTPRRRLIKLLGSSSSKASFKLSSKRSWTANLRRHTALQITLVPIHCAEVSQTSPTFNVATIALGRDEGASDGGSETGSVGGFVKSSLITKPDTA